VTWVEGGLIIPKYIRHISRIVYLMYLIIDVEAIFECPSHQVEKFDSIPLTTKNKFHLIGVFD
jgi:hypothetical protein